MKSKTFGQFWEDVDKAIMQTMAKEGQTLDDVIKEINAKPRRPGQSGEINLILLPAFIVLRKQGYVAAELS